MAKQERLFSSSCDLREAEVCIAAHRIIQRHNWKGVRKSRGQVIIRFALGLSKLTENAVGAYGSCPES